MALGPFYVTEKLREGKGVRGVALLMRHGETEWNRQGRVMGRNPIELDQRGRAQVESALSLARMVKPDLIVTSPLVRARQSAEIIASGLGGLEVIDEPQLEEVRYGSWEGMTFRELIADESYLKYLEEPLANLTPGGESIHEVQRRGVEAVNRAIAANHGRRVLFVSHGDIIRTVLCHFMGLSLEHFRRIRIDNATFSAVEIADHFAEVKFLNLLPDLGRAFVSPF
ncbi:MAG: histidine phosphatase family protein [Candidatus Binataceae bacterium]